MAPLRELMQSGGLAAGLAEPVLRAVTAADFEAAAHKLLSGGSGSGKQRGSGGGPCAWDGAGWQLVA